MSNTPSKIQSAVIIPVFLLAMGYVAFNVNNVEAATDKPTISKCEKRVTILNNRSKLLEKYKQTEEQKYQAMRKKWANRITYSSQWVKKDAEATKKSLQEYDKLHTNLIKELDKQIADYKYLETNPLDCSEANKTELAKKLKEVRGTDSKKKAVGGQARIKKLKGEEARFAKGDFKKSTDKLIEKLHKSKRKNPVPKNKDLVNV